MALFSQRKGIRPAIKVLQLKSIDTDLKNRLWNALTIIIWDQWSSDEGALRHYVETIAQSLWLNYFKLPIDNMPPFHTKYELIENYAYKIIRKYFFEAKWWEVYDFIEFIINNIESLSKNTKSRITPLDKWKKDLTKSLNNILEQENAAYRVIGNKVVEVSNKYEIESIESALDKGVKSSQLHLSRSLELLSDKKSPDYRNSIKESISAVESICQTITGMSKATLGDCIRILKKRETVHPAFEQALLKLYGYTNDDGGIRHALTEKSAALSYADAKFMLVVSSAFINFILAKSSELDIEIHK